MPKTLFEHIEEVEAERMRGLGVDVSEDEPVSDVLYWCAPLPAQMPTDGMLAYVDVTDIRQLPDLTSGTVLLFAEGSADLLGAMVRERRVFGYDMQVLLGVPEATYSNWFTNATFELGESGYSALLSEIRIDAERMAAVSAKSASATDREAAQYTRSDGSVRVADTNEDVDGA